MRKIFIAFLLFFSYFAHSQNNIYRSGGISQTIGPPTFIPGTGGNVVAIDTLTGEWYVNPNRLSGGSWISAGYRLTNISGAVSPAYTPTKFQSRLVINAVDSIYYYNGSSWKHVNKIPAVSITNGGGIAVTGTYPNFTLTATDQSATNELQTIDTFSLSGQTLSASLSSDAQPAKTVTLPVTNVTAGTGISVSSATGNYTVTNSAPDQTVSIANGGGIAVTGSYPSFTLTATDQSITNEIQRLDTFSLSGQTLRASLLNDGVAASSVTLPIVDVVAGTNVTVSKSNGVATVSATGGGGGGTPAGSAGQVQFNSTPAGSFAASANFAWDSTNVRLNIGAPSSPTGRLNVKGSGITSGTVNLRLTNSSNTELVKVADNGNTNFGTGLYWDNVNKRLSIDWATPLAPFVLRASRATQIYYSSGLSMPIPFTNTSSLGPAANGEYVGAINQTFGATGGLVLAGFTSAATSQGFTFQGHVGSTSPTAPALIFQGFKFDGVDNRTAMTGTEGICNFQAGNTAGVGIAMGVKANGTVNIGGDFTPSATVHARGANATSNTYSLIVTNSGGSTTTPAICAQNNQKVGIGTNSVDAGATLEVDGTTGGILFPRLTTTERDALTGVNGLMIYNTTTNKFQGFANGAWVDLH